MMACGDNVMSGHVLFLAMLILSAIALDEPWAQQLPQYWGMCWFLVHESQLVPLMFLQSQTFGKSLRFKYSWGLGDLTSSGIYFGDSLWHLFSLTPRFNFVLASSAAGLVSFLTSFVQVSVGVAHEQKLSRLSIPLINLKFPPSPQ